jgi:hypothetical protein
MTDSPSTPAPAIPKIVIWSSEHGRFWRKNAAGYSAALDSAGRWTLDEAKAQTEHCGPEKQITLLQIIDR